MMTLAISFLTSHISGCLRVTRLSVERTLVTESYFWMSMNITQDADGLTVTGTVNGTNRLSSNSSQSCHTLFILMLLGKAWIHLAPFLSINKIVR